MAIIMRGLLYFTGFEYTVWKATTGGGQLIVTAFEQWLDWSREYNMLPCVGKFPLSEGRDRLIDWFPVWERAAGQAVVLESGKDGRYTFVGLKPVSVIRGKGRKAQVTEPLNGRLLEWTGDPIPLMKRWMAPYRAPRVEGVPKFIGGCIGYLSYDVIRSLESLPIRAEDDLGLPDYGFMRFDHVWVIDHQESELYCAVHSHIPADGGGQSREALFHRYKEASEQVQTMYRQWNEILSVNGDPRVREVNRLRTSRLADAGDHDVDTIPGLLRSMTKEDFIAAVQKIREYISAGDVFQVNLSVRQSRKFAGKAESVYEWLRLINPSPYMGFLQFGDFQIVSCSPELLVQLEDRRIRTRPIAGTRPRGSTAEEDRRLAEELINSEKERAEHVMLVDLMRNDLGKVSKYGSVKVPEFMAIEYYSHVMHIVSQVEGELAEDKDAYDVIAAAFPGGTITGAPKIRTMEIIEELEPVRRGPYTGSIGWIGYNGNMEMNIVIRTLIVAGGVGHVQAGAGIVIDSVPEKEYAESLNKAKAVWKAIRLSEEEMCGF